VHDAGHIPVSFSDWGTINPRISVYIIYIHDTVAQDGTDRVTLDTRSTRIGEKSCVVRNSIIYLCNVRSGRASPTLEALCNALACVFAFVIRPMQKPCHHRQCSKPIASAKNPRKLEGNTYQSTFRSALRPQTQDGQGVRAN